MFLAYKAHQGGKGDPGVSKGEWGGQEEKGNIAENEEKHSSILIRKKVKNSRDGSACSWRIERADKFMLENLEEETRVVVSTSHY